MLVRAEGDWALRANAAMLLRCQGRQRLAILGAFVATLFSLVGLTIPLIWSAANPELRLTLANSGFLFNSLFTLINVFLVESEIARMIDGQCARLRPMVQGLYTMRFLAGMVAAPLLLVLT